MAASTSGNRSLPATSRPQLRPGLPRVWRGPDTLQVGLSPTSGAVVTGLRDGDDTLVSALNGTRTLAELRTLAREQGMAPERVDLIVRLLRDAGLLVTERGGDRPADRADLARLDPRTRRRLEPDAQAWAAAYPGAGDGLLLLTERSRRHVHVEGEGRVAAALVTTLACAGVGVVTTRDMGRVRDGDVLPAGAGASDVGAAGGAALRQAVERVRGVPPARPPRLTGRVEPLRPDLTVLVADDVVDCRRGDDLVRHDVPHLAVVVSPDRVVVGPLVLPGRTPCLRCLDLHRRDRDPGWPQVVAQLLSGQVRRDRGRAETASATAAAGIAALQVLVLLDGHTTPASVGRTLEITLPDGLVERRAWRLHPSCGCARLPRSPRVGARGTPA
jgi:bacteriocin biosynthesis cyclodehydratase domain-containing protein